MISMACTIAVLFGIAGLSWLAELAISYRERSRDSQAQRDVQNRNEDTDEQR
jgi:hypothetical protein